MSQDEDPEQKRCTARAWEKTGATIAWDLENPRRQELFEEAKKMNDAETLWQTHSRRSKQGKVPRTLLVVSGKVDMKNLAATNDDGEEAV